MDARDKARRLPGLESVPTRSRSPRSCGTYEPRPVRCRLTQRRSSRNGNWRTCAHSCSRGSARQLPRRPFYPPTEEVVGVGVWRLRELDVLGPRPFWSLSLVEGHSLAFAKLIEGRVVARRLVEKVLAAICRRD